MAQMSYPPANWNQTVNTIDTIVLEYTSPYPGVNLTLWCETVEGTGDWIWWYLPGPLASDGEYNLHLSSFDFVDSVSVWPTLCHFDLTNSKNKTQVVNGGRISLSTAAAANVAETTYSKPGVTSSRAAASTLASPTGVSSGVSKSGASTMATATSTSTSTSTPSAVAQSSGLSQGAKVGLGVGVGLGGALLLLLGLWAMFLFRKRRRAQAAKAQTTQDTGRFEKAELLGQPVLPHTYNELSAGSGGLPPQSGMDAKKTPDTNGHSQWSAPQELAGSTAPPDGQALNAEPAHRYELPS